MSHRLCECGCGFLTPIATRSNNKFGHIKGQPLRYILGHVQKRWIDKTPEQRFWDQVEKTEHCWIWTGTTDKHGYGRIRRHRKGILAHRYAYQLLRGPLPSSVHLLHDCDNPSCVRIELGHVRPGSPKENLADASVRGRTERGEHHHNAKLTADDVKIIRAAHANGISQASLSKRFHVSSGTICEIIHRKLWKHFP